MVMKYLDPKADLTFKKIFGNHPKRMISLLNALLPLSEEEQIHEIKYLPTELVPQLEGGKNTIVDVLCTDARGRKFCVEMQMEWSDAFQQRVLFNASKLYVSQAKKGGKYSELQHNFQFEGRKVVVRQSLYPHNGNNVFFLFRRRH
jgi:predicted transposase/invertase (TIGR01784 family)